jgi:hypothetical protein
MVKSSLVIILISLLSIPVFADNDRGRNDIRNFRNDNGRSNNRRDNVGNQRGDRRDSRRTERDNARDRMRDFFCSRTGRCRPGDPQVDELSTAAMGLATMGFVSLILYRNRRDELGIKKEDC